MWTWWRLAAAAGLCGLLAACGGGGGGTDDGSTIPARAGEAEIGAAGGTVDAVLEGGTTLRIDIPADALKSAATLRIEPVPAQAGDLGGFRVTPADLVLDKPVSVTLAWAGDQAPPANIVLALRRDGRFVAISPAMQGTQLRFELTSLGKLPAAVRDEATGGTATSRASREQVRSGRQTPAAPGDPAEAEGETMHLTPMTPDQRFEALTQLVELAYNGGGTVAYALEVQAAFDTYVNDPQTDRAAPALQRLASHWEGFFCPQYTAAVNALEAYNGSAGAVFERRVRPVVLWGRVLRDFNRTGRTLSPRVAGLCTRPDGYSFAPVIEKLPEFIAAVEAATRTAGFDQIIDDELPPLIRVEELLQYVGINGRMFPLLNLLTVQLRDLANESCRNGQGQGHHVKLLARTLGDAGFVAIAPYDAAAVKDDIQRCGMRLQVSALDANERPTVTIHNLGASASPTEVLMTRVRKLRIKADQDKLHALQCPTGTPSNNEQLVLEAGVPGQGMTELSRISPSDASYLEQPQSIEYDAARLAELRNPATQTTTLRIRRAGGLCNGAFPEVTEHVVLVELNLVFGVETWSGTISGTYDVTESRQSSSNGGGAVIGGAVVTSSSFAETATQSLNGTWNVTVDVVPGRQVSIRVLSADGTATSSLSHNSGMELFHDGLKCRIVERWNLEDSAAGQARVEGSRGTLWVDNSRFALNFAGAFEGAHQAQGTHSIQEIMAPGPCHEGNQTTINPHPGAGSGPWSGSLGTTENTPFMGEVGNGVISGSETRNLPVQPRYEGDPVTGSRVLTLTWSLQRQ